MATKTAVPTVAYRSSDHGTIPLPGGGAMSLAYEDLRSIMEQAPPDVQRAASRPARMTEGQRKIVAQYIQERMLYIQARRNQG